MLIFFHGLVPCVLIWYSTGLQTALYLSIASDMVIYNEAHKTNEWNWYKKNTNACSCASLYAPSRYIYELVIFLRASDIWHIISKLSNTANDINKQLKMFFISREQRTGIAIVFEIIPTTPIRYCSTYSVQYENWTYCSSACLYSVLLQIGLVALVVEFILRWAWNWNTKTSDMSAL